MTRRRIIFLINSLTGGGAERVMCTLLRHSEAQCREFDVTLALLDDEPAAYEPPDWVKLRQLDARKSAWRSVRQVRALFAEIQPDATLSFLVRSNLANVVNAQCPALISERANTSAHFATGIGAAASRAMVRAIYPRARRVIAVSQGVADDLVANFGLDAAKVEAIPNPLDVTVIAEKARAPASLEAGARYVFAAGRLVPSKNFALLIRAFAAGAPADWNLIIAGEGPEWGALARLASELGVGTRVMLPGFIDNPYVLMRRAELFVLSSNSEGFPNALVEAMALGVPVVATNCPSGPSEILAEAPRERVTGLTRAAHGVLTPQDDVAAMTAAIAAMVDPALRESYAEKAAARALDYGAAAITERYWRVIRSVLP